MQTRFVGEPFESSPILYPSVSGRTSMKSKQAFLWTLVGGFVMIPNDDLDLRQTKQNALLADTVVE